MINTIVMTELKLIISPKTKVGELLQAYPELEPLLISLSPMFEKLKNPVLRRTVAKVATLQQVSVVGGLSVDVIVNRLRKEVGQDQSTEDSDQKPDAQSEQPTWFREDQITMRYDATPVINSGGSPMNEVIQKANSLSEGEILELQTPFVPAPILDMLKGKNFKIYTAQQGSSFFSYIRK